MKRDIVLIPPQRMERELWERIKAQAMREKRSAASLVRDACARYLEVFGEFQEIMKQRAAR